MQPKVSLILTTYNCKEHLECTLQNIMQQDYANLEIIIKDGKSEDGTLEIIKKYQKAGLPIIWISQDDDGIYDAMNQGYLMSSGDFIVFFNDRFTRNDAISLLVQAIQDKGEECIGVHANLIYTEDEQVVRYWRMKEGKIRNGWMPGHPTLLLKREVFEQYGLFKINYKCSADYEFMARVFKEREDLAYVDKTLVRMYYGGTSTNGLNSYLLSLKESHRALKENGYHFIWFIDFIRIIRVLCQFGEHKKRVGMSE